MFVVHGEVLLRQRVDDRGLFVRTKQFRDVPGFSEGSQFLPLDGNSETRFDCPALFVYALPTAVRHNLLPTQKKIQLVSKFEREVL
jgi:hypothetical protein